AAGLTAATTAPTSEVNTERAEFVTQYNELMGQIDELAEDSGFNGVNLLDGDDLSVIFNEDGSSTLSITGVSFDATGLGLSELASTGLDTDASINSTLDTLDTAVSSLRSQASEFGSNLSIVETRENFTKSMINTLETGAANLTLADTNEEGANLLALQTRQQLSSTALSLASQADQNVLRLF
ncbi:MAG: flagellin, partial [Pseudomonadota bacterium]